MTLHERTKKGHHQFADRQKAKDISHRLPGGERCRKRKRSTTLHERTRKGHHQTDRYSNCLKGSVGETAE